MWFVAVVLVVIGAGIVGEMSGPLLKALGRRYATDWKYFGWLKAESIYVASDDGRRHWINHVSIEISSDGLAIYFPFFKRYLKSFRIPWEDVRFVDVERETSFLRLPSFLKERFELYICTCGISIEISKKHRELVEHFVSINCEPYK